VADDLKRSALIRVCMSDEVQQALVPAIVDLLKRRARDLRTVAPDKALLFAGAVSGIEDVLDLIEDMKHGGKRT
jgi:hypothetical protein